MTDDAQFPMPKTISTDLRDGARRDYEAYAPKPKPNLAELENAIKAEAPRYPSYPANANDPVVQIKAQIKLLTHRQMRDMCKAIAEAHRKVFVKNAVESGDTDIAADELADTLDRFAYGE